LITVQEEENGVSSSVGGISPALELSQAIAHALASEPLDGSNKGAFQTQLVTSKIPERNVPIPIAVIDEHSFTRECITESLQEHCNLLDVAAFAACEDCLRSPRTHDLILYHLHESVAARDNGQSVKNIKKLLEIAPVVVLCDVDCIESILAAFESGARGYIPTQSTAIELAVEIIHLVKAGGTFVPSSVLSPRVMGGECTTPKVITTQQFTPRQTAVLEHLKLGKTNKIIAHELGMSESTVKVHIRNIMKKLKATNRTEVACRAHELETNARRTTD
jgi:DNA-binding NarL/FixJ family response regulator